MTVIQNLDLVTLEYRSSQLPSSQHRAGLAGLILKIRWLQEQDNFKQSVDTVCKIIDLDADKVTLQFNLNGLTALLKSHYSASFEEQESKKLRTKGHKNFRKIEREVYNAETDKRALTTLYIYRDLVPQGYLVQSFEPPDNDNRVWTKLWQEATWTILRPRDKQRLPFKAMANGTEPSEIEKTWNILQNKPNSKVQLSSTYMLGAQAKNNEGVPFTDLAKNQFLLNFWSYVAQIYLPIIIDVKDKVKLYGYAITIPDVRNLADFCQLFPSILQQRDTRELWGKPKSAIIRCLEEAGLDSLGSIHTYLSQLKSGLNVDQLLFGMDVFHIVRPQDKPQSKPKILSIQHYLPNREAIAKFTQLQNKLYDPLFRQQYWQNLIRDQPKIDGFYNLLQDLPTAKTLKNGLFCQDFRTVFNLQNNSMEQEEIDTATSTNSQKSDKISKQNETKEISIESLLLRLLKTYTRHQLERRFKLKWDENWDNKKEEFKHNKAYQNYKEKRKQIIIDLHHDFRRPREAHEFLAYFAAKFTDVYQYITTEEYLLLAQLIQTKPEQIRILCLLALPVL